jgi:DNA-binding NarL/FixJ family response regulator
MSAPAQLPARIGLLLSDDMIFTSRITGTARDLGFVIKPARSLAALHALLPPQLPSCIILDLAHPELQVAVFLEDLRSTGSPMPRVIAYGSHIDTATLCQAREAGCAVVLPRSKFVEELPRALPEWMGEGN